MSANRVTQEEELCALKSIFDEEFTVNESPSAGGDPEGRLVACVDLPGSFSVKWRDPKDSNPEAVKEVALQHLPPIVLTFSLPEDYPTQASPDFALFCDWLGRSDVSALCKRLHELWEEDKDVILYKWASFLKEEALQFLNVVDALDITELQKQFATERSIVGRCVAMKSGVLVDDEKKDQENSPETEGKEERAKENPEVNSEGVHIESRKRSTPKNILLKMLQEHNKQKLQEIFDKDTFCCDVCFMTAAGSKCIQFQPCGHVFCKRCVKDYVEVSIKDGRVTNMSCLETDCKSPVLQSHVKELVSNELFASYDQQLLTVSLTSMSDVTLCPFRSCETPVLFDPEDNMASCPSCQYVFCIHCKMGYHGVEPCRIRTEDKVKLVRDYLASTGKAKEELERRYGKRPLQILANNVMSQQWIDANSKPCPKCSTNIEKLDGCNKMQCWRCMSNFCWLCTKLITDPDPYTHFSSLDSKCNGLLFHGLPAAYDFDIAGEEEDEEDEDSLDDDYELFPFD